jgi:hypothetical protein
MRLVARNKLRVCGVHVTGDGTVGSPPCVIFRFREEVRRHSLTCSIRGGDAIEDSAQSVS